MDEWGNRQLRTNKLVRLCAEYLIDKGFTPSNLYGLCKLTWITSSSDSENGNYIRSTKLPGLSDVFNFDFSNYPYDKIGVKIAKLTGASRSITKDLIYGGTGYTNFYKAYRNSSKIWIEQNFVKILPLIHSGFNIKIESQAENIIKVISKLPKIPKGNNAQGSMMPEYLLTPLFFSLDKRIKFPLINGNEGVTKLLNNLKIKNATLLEKHKTITALIGKWGIKNAIDIDILRGELPEFVSINGEAPKRKLLSIKDNKDLSLKDEEDVRVIKKALSIEAKRLHNKLTNFIKTKLYNYSLHEGKSKENMFDVLVKNFNNANQDLLIEVKSSSEIADVRMAVGQLLDYSRQLINYKNTLLAVFLPEKPDKHVIDFLNFHKIFLLWREKDEIISNIKDIPFAIEK